MIEALYSDFIHFLDSIFYEGYAEQFAKENPEAFTMEWQCYLDQYSKIESDEHREKM